MLKTTSAEHPLKTILDNIWNAGHTPRIVVDATHKDVLVPEWLRAQHKDHLVLDLKAADPMNFEFGLESFSADFAFSGTVVRCTIPWRRLSTIVDRETGNGIRITDPEKMIEDVPVKDDDKTPTDQPVVRGPFRVFKGGKS